MASTVEARAPAPASSAVLPKLALVGVVGLAALAVATVVATRVALGRIERLITSHNEQQVRQALTDLSGQLRERPDHGDWFVPLARRQLAAWRLEYVCLFDASGGLLVSVEAQGVAAPTPQALEDLSKATGEGGAEAAGRRIRSWFGRGYVRDRARRLRRADGTSVTVHLGQSEERLLDQVEAEQRELLRVVLISSAASAATIALALLAVWVLIRRSLQASREDARAAHLAELGQLASGLVHELRTPLNAMRMEIATLRRQAGADADLDGLEAEVLRLGKLADGFLELGKAGVAPAGRVQLAPAVRALVEEQAGAGPGTLTLEVAPDAEEAVVGLGAEQVRQVLGNLLQNARGALPAEGGTIAVRLDVEPGRRGRARLEVADDGAGIAAEDVPHVLEPYFSRREAGTGLGLLVVSRIVHSAGGDLALTSEPGAGTQVVITLPLLSGEAA